MHIYTGIHTETHTHIHAKIYTFIHRYIHINTYKYIHMYMHRNKCSHAHRTHLHIEVNTKHIYIYEKIITNIYT